MTRKTSEDAVQSMVRRDFAFIGPIWRNNNGACYDKTGRLIRYGLGNDSAKVNKKIKSSDLIGITPVVVTPEMVGQTIGVFTAVECKPSDWKLRASDDRGQAQLMFHMIVHAHGGYAGFATHPSDIERITRKEK